MELTARQLPAETFRAVEMSALLQWKWEMQPSASQAAAGESRTMEQHPLGTPKKTIFLHMSRGMLGGDVLALPIAPDYATKCPFSQTQLSLTALLSSIWSSHVPGLGQSAMPDLGSLSTTAAKCFPLIVVPSWPCPFDRRQLAAFPALPQTRGSHLGTEQVSF